MSKVVDSLPEYLRQQQGRLDRLEATAEESCWRVRAGLGTADPPTSAQLTTEFGAPATLPEGFRAVVESATNQWYVAFVANAAWWIVGAGGPGVGAYWRIGGNALGAALVGGTTDNNFVYLRTNNVNRLIIENAGNYVAVAANYLLISQGYLWCEQQIEGNTLGGDFDSYIQGDNDANLFYCDAGNDRVGIGTSTPQGKLHGSGSVGRWLAWDGTTVGAGAATVIPNAAGDVTGAITLLYSVQAVTGADATGGMCVLTPGNNWTLYDDGTDVLVLYCNADGSVTVQRTAGADTWRVALWATWI